MEDYTTYLLKLSYLYVQDRQIAEDIVQEVFVKLYHQNPTNIEPGKEKSYIVKMTINRCKDYLKSWHFQKIQVKSILGLERSYKQKDHMILEEEQSQIGREIFKLPLKYREVLILYYFEEQSVSAISELLHIPLGTVKTRLIKSRNLLKERLHQSEWEVLKVEE